MQSLVALSGQTITTTSLPSTSTSWVPSGRSGCINCLNYQIGSRVGSRDAALTCLNRKGRVRLSVSASSSESVDMESVVIEKAGVTIQRNPPESKLSELGVKQWPKWGCPPSKFPWTYSARETCYLLKGKVKVTPDGTNEAVEFGAGDLVVFPKDMSCTWDVSEEVDKHYKFD